MQLFFQEKFLSGKMVISDMEGNPVYTGKKHWFWGDIMLKDNNKKKIAKIKERSGMFNKGFHIYEGRKKVAQLKRKFSLVNQKFSVKKLNWEVTGNFIAKEYTVKKGEEVIATIKRNKLLAITEGYTVDVVDDANAVKVICIVLVLNTILGRNKKKLIKK